MSMHLQEQIRPSRKFNRFSDIKNLLDIGKLSCVDLFKYYNDNIKLNEHLNAFLDSWTDEALIDAARIDEKIKNGNAGRLA
jgi:aspartyl-tRNA(Asn)/glutamyl-tRNA(Gln) amidotransferase subunit A